MNILLRLTVDEQLTPHGRDVDLLVIGTLRDENALRGGNACAQVSDSIADLCPSVSFGSPDISYPESSN